VAALRARGQDRKRGVTLVAQPLPRVIFNAFETTDLSPGGHRYRSESSVDQNSRLLVADVPLVYFGQTPRAEPP
jgi:hypothetical protein